MAKKSDPAHLATDAEIAKLEKLIAKEYKKAHKEASQKLDDYLAAFVTKDEKWQEWVAAGTKTQKEYKEWRTGQMMIGKRWKDLVDSLASDYTNAAKIAQSITKGFVPEVYAINHNYATFDVEKKALLDTSYSLYSRESVEHMYKGKPKLYHTYGKAVAKEIKEGKQHAWDRRRITSVLHQAIVQGESIPNVTKRLEQVTKGDHKAAIRNARTMMTGVQNAGRVDAYDRAKSLGIPVRKQWLATLDVRTRHWHRELDGVIVESDEPFENEFGKIMFPGDPEAHGCNVYNCRCTLLAAIEGFEIDVTDPSVRPSPKLGNMTYDEWLKDKKSFSNPIDLPEKKAAAIKGAWNAQYGKGGTIQNPVHKHSAAEGQQLMSKYEQEEMNQKYSGIWANKTVTPSDYPKMKKEVNDKKWNLNKQIDKAKAKGDNAALAKYQAQMDELLDFEKQGKKYLKAHPELDPAASKAASKAPKTPKTPKTAKTTKTPQTANAQPGQKEYKNIWANKTVTPEDYPGMKKQVNDKKWNLNKQIDKAKAKGDTAALAKYQKQLDELLDFEKEGQKFLKAPKTAQKTAKAQSTAKAQKTAQKSNKQPAGASKQKKAVPKTEAQAQKAVADAQAKLKAANQDYWPTIWSGGVHPEDYLYKKNLIDSKRKYYQDKLKAAKAKGDQFEIQKYTKNLKMVDEFEKAGKIYEAAEKELDAAKQTLKAFEDAKKAKEAAKQAAKEAKEKAKVEAKKKTIQKTIDDLDAKEYDLGFVGFYGDSHATLADVEAHKKAIKAFKKAYGNNPYFADEMKILEEVEKDLKARRKAEAALDKLSGKKKPSKDAIFTNPDPKKTVANAQDFSYAYHESQNFDWSIWRAMSSAERNGLQSYTGSSYGAMNDIMRGLRSPDPHTVKLIDDATDAVSHFQLKEDTKLYRGMGGDRALSHALGVPVDEMQRMLDDGSIVGQVFSEDGFGSTAATRQKAWYKKIMLEIYAPKGTQAMYVDPVSRFKGEKEILLQRGTRFEVIDVKESGGQYWLRVVIVDQCPKKF